MSITEMNQSRAWIFSAPLAYRLLQRSMSVTVEETATTVAAAKAGDVNDALRAAVESLRARTGEFDECWQTLTTILTKTGVPGLLLVDILQNSRGFIESGRKLLGMLGANTTAYAAEIERWAAVFDRIDPQLAALEKAQAAPVPEFDPERARIGEEQMERGEGEDAEVVLKRFLDTEKL